MRDPARIEKFCTELAEVWKKNVPGWRFGQLVLNVFGKMWSESRDPFFPEEDEMLDHIKNYFQNERS